MCVLSVDTSSSPADPNMSTRPPGQPSLKPSMKTACLNRRKDGAPTRSDVESVEMVLAMSLWMTDPNTASHASEYSAALWSSFLKWRMSNSRALWMWESGWRSSDVSTMWMANETFWRKAQRGTFRARMCKTASWGTFRCSLAITATDNYHAQLYMINSFRNKHEIHYSSKVWGQNILLQH